MRFNGHVPERDGILAGLFLLDMMVQTGKKPSQLLQDVFDKVVASIFMIVSIAVLMRHDKPAILAHVGAAMPETIGGLKVTDMVTIDGHQFIMEDGGWLLVRFSGTEPIIRVYCETTHGDRVQAILDDGMKIAGLR